MRGVRHPPLSKARVLLVNAETTIVEGLRRTLAFHHNRVEMVGSAPAIEDMLAVMAPVRLNVVNDVASPRRTGPTLAGTRKSVGLAPMKEKRRS